MHASAAEQYAKAEKLGDEAIHYAMEIKVRAARKAGELLIAMLKSGGRDPGHRKKKIESRLGIQSPPQLSDLGISNKQSARWQDLARIPEPAFERLVKGDKPTEREIARAPLGSDVIPSPCRSRRITLLRERATLRFRTGSGSPSVFFVTATKFSAERLRSKSLTNWPRHSGCPSEKSSMRFPSLSQLWISRRWTPFASSRVSRILFKAQLLLSGYVFDKVDQDKSPALAKTQKKQPVTITHVKKLEGLGGKRGNQYVFESLRVQTLDWNTLLESRYRQAIKLPDPLFDLLKPLASARNTIHFLGSYTRSYNLEMVERLFALRGAFNRYVVRRFNSLAKSHNYSQRLSEL